MNWTEALVGKWIPQSSNLDLCFKLVNRCVYLTYDPSGVHTGFTVGNCNLINKAFINKIQNRIDSLPADCQHELIHPPICHEIATEMRDKITAANLKIVQSPFVEVAMTRGGLKKRSKMRVINVDDSPVILKLLEKILGEQPWFDIVAQIKDPNLVMEAVERLDPDVMTLDIQMPGKNGVQVLKEVLGSYNLPTIMLTGLSELQSSLVFDALNSGAFDYIQKPSLTERDRFSKELQERVLATQTRSHVDRPKISPAQRAASLPMMKELHDNSLWAIGSSTGGTQALTRVFTGLPDGIPPTLIVQHIPAGFSKAFANSLNNLCPFTCKEAEDGEPILKNHVYIAPGGLQMGVVDLKGVLTIELKDSELVNRFKPSVDYLFGSLEKLTGTKLVAGILTGMGQDGAAGLLKLKVLGAATFAQDEASSAVYGMPMAAANNGAASAILDIDVISDHLLSCSTRPHLNKKIKLAS